jgi:hypothetical protein
MTIYDNSSKHKFLVGDKSSIDIIGMFLAIIRDRFSNNPVNFPWQWSQDETISRIFIDAGGVENYSNNDARPAIFIDRSNIVYRKIAMNELADYSLRDSRKTYISKGVGEVYLDCVSKNRGESSLLGDICSTHLLMSDDIFRALYSFQDIGPVNLGVAQPWDKDDRVFVTRVGCEFSYDISWTSTRIGDRLERIKGLIISDIN